MKDVRRGAGPEDSLVELVPVQSGFRQKTELKCDSEGIYGKSPGPARLGRPGLKLR